jgi:GNAT superfamily N-acetyltransferase
MHRIRVAVRENRLATMVLSEADYVPEMESTGRGWVAEEDGRIVGFAIGNATNGNIWALFVDPDYEKRGHGRRLHDEMVAWLWSQGLKRLWLTTSPGTRAQYFYESAGWCRTGATPHGEVLYELLYRGKS